MVPSIKTVPRNITLGVCVEIEENFGFQSFREALAYIVEHQDSVSTLRKFVQCVVVGHSVTLNDAMMAEINGMSMPEAVRFLVDTINHFNKSMEEVTTDG